jgi:hypothetical protein
MPVPGRTVPIAARQHGCLVARPPQGRARPA